MSSSSTLSNFEEDLFETVENKIVVKMEEEEETPPTKKARRKRKPKRDFSPETGSAGGEGEELFEEEEEEEEKKPKKRGRKKKKKDPEVPDEELSDLQHIFKVVESLMTAPNAPAFLDRPDETMYGMADYYDVITKPMWLREVEQKYKAGEYVSPTDVAADVRLMLENCYHYWGPNDTLSKKALKLEQTFETKLAALPDHVKNLCTLEATHGNIVKEEPDDSSTSKTNKKGGYVSKLFNWVMNGRNRRGGDEDEESSEMSQEVLVKANREKRAASEKELTTWEAEHLFKDSTQEQIASMWEFPVIGQFLHLVYNVLNIDSISHLELERMLLIPQASKTLATLVTSMLIPPLFRAKLEGGPAMPYSVWTRRLHTKLSSWYRIYRSKGDNTVEVFDSLGIEPQFWLVMGDQNPLENNEFHELSFLQRVWLLKGLCDFLLHNHKTIQDRINNLETEELREMKLGKDKEGYTYHYFPNFAEVRIYKMAKVPDTKWKNYDSGVEEALTMCASEDDEDNPQESNLISGGVIRRPLHCPPRSMRPNHTDFKLVCQSLEDVRTLVDTFCDADPQLLQGEGPNAGLVAALQSIISDLEPREAKMEMAVYKIRNKMRNEWVALQSRSPDFVDPGIVYWERKEKEEKTGTNEEKASLGLDLGVPGTSTDGLTDDGKRERRTRRESSLKLLSKEENGLDDESAEESPLDFDDDSEDEWFASKKDKEIKKKKEKKLISAKKLKKLADISDKMQQSKDPDKLNSSTSGPESNSNNKVKNLSTGSEPPVKIKEELPDPDDLFNKLTATSTLQTKPNQDQTQDSSPPKKQLISVKKEFMEGSQPNAMTTPIMPSQHSVIQTLVPPVNATNVKKEKASKPIAPDLSKVKRSNSPEGDVVYISDSEDTPDIKPSLKLLNQHNNVETINYVVPQQQPPPMGNFLVPNQSQFLPVNVAQPQVYQPTQPMTFQMQPQQIVQQPIIRPTPTIVRLQASPTRPNIPNQKFVVLQPNANNGNQPNQFVNKGPRAQNNFPTTPTMQNVNWFGSRGGAPRGSATYSPRQRGSSMVVGPNQSPRGRGSPRGSPASSPRGGAVPRFSGRTPTTPNSMRMPAQVGSRTPSPMRGRGQVSPVRQQGPVRNLNFNRSPAKPVSKPANDFPPENDSPDIEGTLVVSMTDTGGFGYAVMLPDGGKISLTQEQLTKIRSDNGGTLPKRCKVPLNTPSDVFRID